jgi:hypothetical protein
MKIFNYIDFITEARGDIKCPAIISSSFIKRCKLIESPVADALIDMNRKLSSYTFINDNLDGETIQYTESERAIDLLNKQYGKTEGFNPLKYLQLAGNPDPDSHFWQLNRVDIKVGRFVRRFLTEQFTDAQIEDFVNKWKSQKGDTKFEFRSGNGIVDAYNTKNYEGEEGYNPLWNSCMNNRTDLVDFYLYVVDLEMVVLLNSENQIIGRALLWVDDKSRKFLDRVYYIYDADYFKFIRLAKENGWYYKKRNISGGSSWILDGVESMVDVKIKFPVEAISQIQDDYGYPQFPYVDSFYYLDDKNGYLSNQEPKSSYFLMNDTDGAYEYYSGLYDVHGDRIDDEDDYIFSKTQNGLVSLYNSEHVDYEGFEDYIEIGYLEDPKNGFIFDNDNQQWMRKKDFDKMKSQN